jgi:excinuclease ABC subunit B
MAEELTKYLQNINVQTRYLHSDIKTLERVEIIRDLRLGKFDVLVGVNMLREGLDLPEVSLVAILDADKEGFLRNERSLVQTIGRAARNDKGRVLMYAEKITPSMERAISETNRRRELQEKYNQEHGITLQTVRKSAEQILQQTSFSSVPGTLEKAEESTPAQGILHDPVILGMSTPELEKQASETHEKMLSAAEALNFMEAARFRDEWQALSQLIEARKK